MAGRRLQAQNARSSSHEAYGPEFSKLLDDIKDFPELLRDQPTPNPNGAPDAFLVIHKDIWEIEKMKTTLVDEHKAIDEHKAMIGRLISDDRMKNVWKNLKRRETSLVDKEIREDGPKPLSPIFITPWRALYFQIRGALYSSKLHGRTTAELRMAHVDIEDHSKKLAKALCVLDDYKLSDITTYLDPPTLRALAMSLRDDIFHSPPADIDPEEVFKRKLWPLPRLPVLLDLLAKQAQLEIQRPRRQSRPASRGAQCRSFIQHMSDYFFSRYGARLYQTVATITAVIFDMDEDDVRADRVKKQLKRAAR